jgi:protein-disulfide isomerase
MTNSQAMTNAQADPPARTKPSAKALFVRGALLSAGAILCAALCLAAPPAPATSQLQSAAARKASAPAAVPDKSYGLRSAPIRMDVYSDYQCPYCRAFYDQTLRHVIADYVSAGKVYLVHHDFPLQMHKYSGEAARWANACAEVGQFDVAEAALYDNQDSWGADGNIAKYLAAAMPASDFRRAQAIMQGSAMPAPQATNASVDPMTGVLRPCTMDPFIVQDIKQGYQYSLPGTPDFVVSYQGRAFQPIYSAVSWPVLKQLCDSLLKQ